MLSPVLLKLNAMERARAFHSECCIGGKSVTAIRINLYFSPSTSSTRLAKSTVSQVCDITRPGIEHRLLNLVERTQPIWAVNWTDGVSAWNTWRIFLVVMKARRKIGCRSVSQRLAAAKDISVLL